MLATEEGTEPLTPLLELQLICSEPQYDYDASGVVKRRVTVTERVVIHADAVPRLAKILTQYAEEATKQAANYTVKDLKLKP